ncbi:MAG: glycerophosphodiester phosphodiesterase family protein [Planctomycetota bacterium]
MSKPPIWVIAHRGASGQLPENTLVAVHRALELGADAIECDVHLSADGIPIVFHDEETERMTGARGSIGGRKLEQIRSLSVRDLGPGSIPTLEEWLAAVPAPTGIVIEIKTDRQDYEGIEEAVYRVVEAKGALERSTFISFNLRTLDRIRLLSSEIRIGPVLEGRPEPTAWSRYQALKPSTIVFEGRSMNAADIAEAKSRGWEAWAYTLNSEERIQEGAHLGLTGIISNFPERVFGVLGVEPS